MADVSSTNAAAAAMRGSAFSTAINGFYIYWTWYIYFAFRVGIPLLIWLFVAVWDLVATIFSAIWRIITNYRFLIVFAIIFVALYFIHKYWPEFVFGLRKYIMPALDIIWNDVLRFLWNTLLLTIANLLIYVWDAAVQLIGFFIYFAVNVIVTVAYLVVQILGEIHVGEFIEALLKIITQIVQIVMAVLQLMIKVGVAVLNLVKPILIAILKIYIQYIKILFKIYYWLFVILFKALFFILKGVIVVVKFVLSVFIHKASHVGRSLLGLRDAYKGKGSINQNEELYGRASKLLVFEEFSTAMRYYSMGQYMGFADDMDEVHQGIRMYDRFGTNGEPDEPGLDGGLEHHLYEEDELEEHEKPFAMREAAKKRSSAQMAAQQSRDQGATKKRKVSEDIAKYAKATARKLQSLDQPDLGLFDRLKLVFDIDEDESGEDDSAEKQYGEDIEFELEDDDDRSNSMDTKDILGIHYTERPPSSSYDDQDNQQYEEQNLTDSENDDLNKVGNHWRSDKTIEQRHAEWRLNPEDWWRIDIAHNWTSHQVFPNLKGKKLRRAQLHKLHKPYTPEEHFEVNRITLAYKHAIEHAWYRAHRRHISSGHFHRALNNTWKHLIGDHHKDLTSWIHEKFGPPGNRKYASVGHWLHSVVPDFTGSGIGKLLKDADPESKTRLYHHDWVRSVCPTCTDGVLPRDVYEHLENQERWDEEQDYLNSGNGEPSSPLPDCEGPHAEGDTYCMYRDGKTRIKRQGILHNTGRKLHIQAKFEPFGINLEFLYDRDCFTTAKRNILCIPTIPKTWILPFVDFRGLIFVDDLDNNTACEPTWHSTSCFICWEGVQNMFVELRFSIYFLDIIWKILIVGIFLPAPSEWLGYLAKVFPPLSPFINWFLLYPPGTFPNGQAFACFFINLIYLFELILLFLIAYYIIDPIIEYIRRQYEALYLLIVGFRAEAALRMNYMIDANESILMNIKYNTRRIYRQKLAEASRSSMPINAPLGSDPEGGAHHDAQYHIGAPMSTLDYPPGLDAGLFRRLLSEDPAAANSIMDLQAQIEEKKQRITSRLTALGDRLAISRESIYRDYHHKQSSEMIGSELARGAYRRWQRATELIQLPVEFTLSYATERARQAEKSHLPRRNVDVDVPWEEK